MKLMTTQLERRFRQLGTQVDFYDPLIIAKFWVPWSGIYWYPINYNPDSSTFFGYEPFTLPPQLHLNLFSLKDLENYRHFNGQCIQRDLSFKETPKSQLEDELGKQDLLWLKIRRKP